MKVIVTYNVPGYEKLRVEIPEIFETDFDDQEWSTK